MNFNDTGHWIVSENTPVFGKDSGDYFGFVYKITFSNGFWYIGSKQFTSKRKLKPLKNKVNSRRKVVESDWKTYTSSSNFINEYIEKNGKHEISFEILYLVKGGKFELKYCEMREQVIKNCLFENNCINQIINVRLGHKKNIVF